MSLPHHTRRIVCAVLRHALALALGLVPSTLTSAQVTWTYAYNRKPSERVLAAMAYDSLRHCVILFGGISGDFLPVFHGDTWSWDGTKWTLVSTAGPSPRGKSSMAYDSVRDRVVLCGGIGAGGICDDTWEWDGSSWQRIGPGPSPLAAAGMAFDVARRRTVLFGGTDGLYPLSGTFEWDGSRWTQRATSNAPAAREGLTLTYDGRAQASILFGGTGGVAYDDTWLWNGSNWTKLLPSNASLRSLRPRCRMGRLPRADRLVWRTPVEQQFAWRHMGVGRQHLVPAIPTSEAAVPSLGSRHGVRRVSR